jgi:TonB family protein
MIIKFPKPICILILLLLALTLFESDALSQRITPGKNRAAVKHVTKRRGVQRFLRKKTKRRAARATTRRKRPRSWNVEKLKISPRDPNRYTFVGTPLPSADDQEPVTREVNAPAGELSAVPRQISGGVLNGKVRVLPVPSYPLAARAIRAMGAVGVEVLIDEEGNVVSAHAVSGHPLLRATSVEAAKGAKFSPTKLMGHPVKVRGVITYNFVP